jgi:RNA polymerase sigma-70 factor (ECF subfamily)
MAHREMSRATAPAAPSSNREPSRMRAMVEDNILFVTRTLKKAGVPPSELDDEVQRTFLVAARRLDDVQLGAERSFLYQVALNTAAHLRRKLARRREVTEEQMPERIEALATPEHLTSRKEMRRLLDDVAARMDESLCEVFRLFAFEGANLTEIASRLGLRRGTVASRLRRAREQFRKDLEAIELAWDLGSEGAKRLEEPAVLTREKMSKLMRAMLRAGASTSASASVRVETLAVLGLAPAAWSEV